MHFQMWLWDVRAHHPFTLVLSSLSSSISIQPGGLTLAISNIQRVLLTSHVCFLFTFSIQDVNGRWVSFLVSRSSHRSLSAIQPLKQVQLNYLNFLKLKTSQTCFYFASTESVCGKQAWIEWSQVAFITASSLFAKSLPQNHLSFAQCLFCSEVCWLLHPGLTGPHCWYLFFFLYLQFKTPLSASSSEYFFFSLAIFKSSLHTSKPSSGVSSGPLAESQQTAFYSLFPKWL